MQVSHRTCPRCKEKARKKCPICHGSGVIDEFQVWADDIPSKEMSALLDSVANYRKVLSDVDKEKLFMREHISAKALMAYMSDNTSHNEASLRALTKIHESIGEVADPGIHINIAGGNIGVLNTGTQKNVGAINAHISELNERGEEQLSTALREITQAVIDTGDIAPQDRDYVLEMLEELSRQAALPTNQRSKGAVIKSFLLGIGGTLAAAGGAAEVWTTWGPEISSFFGIVMKFS